MKRSALVQFIRSHRYAVQSSVSASGSPQAAVVGIAVTDDLCLIFDTLDSTRKARNLRLKRHIAFVIGGLNDGDERTVQYEGLADEPAGNELTALKKVYFAKFPDGLEREKQSGIVYIRVRPTWIRYSDYSITPPGIVEFNADHIRHMVEGQDPDTQR